MQQRAAPRRPRAVCRLGRAGALLSARHETMGRRAAFAAHLLRLLRLLRPLRLLRLLRLLRPWRLLRASRVPRCARNAAILRPFDRLSARARDERADQRRARSLIINSNELRLELRAK